MKRIALLAALAAALLPTSRAMADDDFGLWTDIGISKKISKKFSVDAGVDFRAEQKLKSASRWGVSLGATYKPLKCLRFSAGYAYLRDRSVQETKAHYKKETDQNGNDSIGAFNGVNVEHGYWRNKHRFYFDVTARAKAGRFTISLRERYQFTHTMPATCRRDKYRFNPATDALADNPGYVGTDLYTWQGTQYIADVDNDTDEKRHKNAHYLRSRLQVAYDIRHCPLTPFVSYELSNNLADGFNLDKTRLSVGTDWDITKQHQLSLAYIYQNGADDDGNDDIHVVSIGYKFSF